MMRLPFRFLNKNRTALTTLEAHELTKRKFTLNNPSDRKDPSL